MGRSILVLVFLQIVFSALYYGSPMKQKKFSLGEYDQFSLVVPEERYQSDDNSTVFMELSSNEFLVEQFVNPREISTLDFICGEYIALVDSEEQAYIVCDNVFWLLSVKNLTEKMKLTSLGRLTDETNNFYDVVVEGDLMFVSQYRYLYVFNISNLKEPKRLSKNDITCDSKNMNNPMALFSKAPYLFVSDAVDGVFALNLTNTNTLYCVKRFPYPIDQRVLVVDNYLMIGYHSDYLRILDITNITSPITIFQTSIGEERGKKFVFSANNSVLYSYGYFLNYVVAFDVSDWNNVNHIESTKKFGNVKAMAVRGNYVYVSNVTGTNPGSQYQIFKLHVSKGGSVLPTPCALQRTTVIAFSGFMMTFSKDGRLYSTLGDPGFEILDEDLTKKILSFETPTGSAYPSDTVEKLAVLGDLMVIEGSDNIVHFLIRRENSQFEHISTIFSGLTSTSSKSALQILPNKLVFYGGIINASDPYHPKVLWKFSSKVYDCIGDISQNLLYLGTDSGLLIYNISDVTAPFLISTVNPGKKVSRFLLRSEDQVLFAIAFFDSTSGILAVDLSNPNSTRILSKASVIEFGFHSMQDLAVKGDTVFLADSSDGIKVMDYADVEDPKLLSTLDMREAVKLFLASDHQLVVADQSYSLDIVNIDDVMNMKVSSSYDFDINNMCVQNNYVYATENRKLSVVRFDVTIVSSDVKFPVLCENTDVTMKAFTNDPSDGSLSDTFEVDKKSYCNNNGKCLENYRCECHSGYSGTNCDFWSCGYVFTDIGRTCSGHGHCKSPNKCKCDSGFKGDLCETNMMYLTIMTPALASSAIFFVTVVVLISACCLLCACVVATLACCGCICILGCCGWSVARLLGRVKKYKKLKNFDILLAEQKAEEDHSIAHLKVDKSLFEIPYDEIVLVRILGEGGSNSIVYEVKWRGQIAAFKCFKTRHIMGNQTDYDEFEREVTILGNVKHPHILQFIGCCLDPPRIGILMNHEKTLGSSYAFEEKYRMCLEICQAMDYLHSRRIIHRDLKLENVLVTKAESTKIMDFGLSRRMERLSAAKTKNIGTSFYIAPEVIMSAKYNEKCDVFSFSIMMYIMFSEQYYPYGLESTSTELKVAQNPDFRPKLEILRESIPEEYQWMVNVVSTCWDHDSKKRMSFSELIVTLEEKKVGGEKDDRDVVRIEKGYKPQLPAGRPRGPRRRGVKSVGGLELEARVLELESLLVKERRRVNELEIKLRSME